VILAIISTENVRNPKEKWMKNKKFNRKMDTK